MKWYMSIVVLLLAFFGISLEESTVANQEIVVQFHEGEVTIDETENAISLVKEQLQILGVKNIQVLPSADGEALRITYYSAIDVAIVEQKFSNESEGQLGTIASEEQKTPIDFPIELDLSGYRLNVSEIQTIPDAPLNLNGTLLEFTTGSELYVHPVVYFNFNDNNFHLKKNTEQVAYNLYGYQALTISDAPYSIPEARAGPLA